MTKKTIILILLIVFLSSVIVPNYASAMGTSLVISDSVGWGLLAGFIILIGGIIYYQRKSSTDPKEDKKEKEAAKKITQSCITPEGEYVLFRW